jgi:hypothetical protein
MQKPAHQIQTMTTPPNTTTPTALSNRFTPLTNEPPTEPSIDTCDPTPYTPTISTTPSAGRFGTTRRKTHKHRNTLTLATLNINGLNKHRLGKLTAMQHLMTTRNIHILAVQESHENASNRIKTTNGFTYFGELSGAGRKAGGNGFLVDNKIAHMLTYLGPLNDPSKHATTWGLIKGKSASTNVYIGSVYLPNTGSSNEAITAARDLLVSDIEHYTSKPGRILLLGDFNAWVGHANDPGTSDHPPHSPLFGDPTTNTPGRDLLSMCELHDLFFLTNRDSNAFHPTYRHTTTVDYIIGSRDTLAWSPTATTIASTDPDLTCCRTDHAMLTIEIAIPRTKYKRTKQRFQKWRLSNLRDPKFLTAYSEALLDQRRHHLDQALNPLLVRKTKATRTETTEAVRNVITSLESAARSSIGQKTIVPGITKPWMTAALANDIHHRLNANIRWHNDKTPANANALLEADQATRKSLRKGKIAHDRIITKRVNEAWSKGQGDHAAYHSLKSLRKTNHTNNTITALLDSTGIL